MTTTTAVAEIPPINRREAGVLAATENRRVVELLRSLDDAGWTRATDCPAWDVRAMAGHLLGSLEGFTGVRPLVRLMRAAGKAAGDGPFVDGMTSVQVRANAGLDRSALLERMAAAGPRQAAWRARRSPMRAMPMKEEVGGVKETWKAGYLLDTILTRDTWMHRVDIARATGCELVLSADHDGRLVADVVAEWARRHGQPFTLHLEGLAGGTFTTGPGTGETLTLDAVEFCRILSGRASGTGLLTQEVPF
ncbi:MAG: maleylpyruvate isomerase family mycothiol-dependent enzyme [Actinomycetota bacterium]|nr:maleylpyruvate isomerase family mycothiol-dependent enzyme [Actinomycetota bacterium]